MDRDITPEMISRLATGAAVDPKRIESMAFSALEGLLWESYGPRGGLVWITSLARWGRRRTGYGQQYCRLCLANDPSPYFRRRWRLTFNVVCSEHHIYLRDQCGTCASPVEFHVGDFGKGALPQECPIVFCGTCGADFREPGCVDDISAPESLIYFQQELNSLLCHGCPGSLPIVVSHSHLFFEGLRILITMLTSCGKAGRLRELMLSHHGLLPFNARGKRRSPSFEELRVGDRAMFLSLCAELLHEWPKQFVERCKQAKVSSSYISSIAHYSMPYWLYAVVRCDLDDSDYAPSLEEKKSAEKFLLNNGCSASKNAINRLLGVAHVSTRINTRVKRKRWNPRGPRQLWDRLDSN